MIDYMIVGISIVIFIFYLMTILLSIDIKKRLNKDAGVSFIYLIIAVLFLAIRRIQQIFVQSDIMKSIPYFADFITLIFAALLFMAVFHFHKSIKAVGRKSSEESKSKPLGIKLLLGGLALLILINLLSRFGIISLVNIQPDLLSMITVLFVATEIGVRSVLSGAGGRKKLGKAGWFGTIVVILLFLMLMAGWVGITFPNMELAKGGIEIALLFFVFAEIIK
ncbi:MAG: hypothetical protein AABX26_03515 [Nanoarchaeota archaeon]